MLRHNMMIKMLAESGHAVFKTTPMSSMQIYYYDGCLRYPANTCLNSTNAYYPMTDHGLNLLTYYFLDQADRLANGSAADINIGNPRFRFIWEVQHSCLLLVLQAAAQSIKTRLYCICL